MQSRKSQERGLDIRTAAGASTKSAAEETEVRGELVAAQQARDTLQKRLEEVTREAHLGVARLRQALEQAETTARRAQEKLLDKLNEAAVDREQARKSADATAKEEMKKLRQELQVAVEEEHRLHKELMKAQQNLREAVDAKRKEEASRKAAEQAAQSISAELNRTNAEAFANETQLKQQLATRSHADQLETAELEWKRSNATATLAAAAELDRKIKQSRMGLLEQIAGLQGTVQQEQKALAAANQEARKATEEANHEVQMARQEQKQREESQRRSAAILLDKARRAQANLTAAAAAGSAAQAEVVSLRQAVAGMEDKLKMVEAEDSDLRAARDAATKGEAAFQAMDAKAEVALAQQKQSLDSAQRQLRDIRAKYEESERRAATSANQVKAYQAKFLALRDRTNAALQGVNEKLHDTMLTAASKVRELEDSGETLAAELQQAKSQLSEVSADSAKAKDTLLQETDAALKASQKAEKLDSQLQEVEKAASQNSSMASQLQEVVSKLRTARDHAVEEVDQRESNIADWRLKVETLQHAVDKQTEEATEAQKENKELKREVSQLAGEGKRADALQEQINKLRAEAQKNATREVQLIDQMARLRGLKESYSEEYEDEHKESDTWEAKAEDLESRLQSARKEKDALRRTQEAALERVRSARSEEDEYFEENAKLQSQNEALSQKLHDESATANSSAQEADLLREQVQDLRASEARDEQDSHAALVANERELQQARHDLETAVEMQGNVKYELERTRAVLDDSQRQKLGLPAAPAGQSGRPPPAAPLPVAAAVGAAGVGASATPHPREVAPVAAPPPSAAEAPALVGQFGTTSFVPFVPEPDLPVTVTLPPALLKDDDDDDDPPPPSLPAFPAKAAARPASLPTAAGAASAALAALAARASPVAPAGVAVPSAPAVLAAPAFAATPVAPDVAHVALAAPVALPPPAAPPMALAVPALPAEPVVPMATVGPAVPDALASMVGSVTLQAAALSAAPAVPSQPLPSAAAPAQPTLPEAQPLAGVASLATPEVKDKGSTLQSLAAYFASPLQH